MRRLLDWLVGWLTGRQRAVDAAQAEARVAEVRRKATEDRAKADETARKVEDAMAELRRKWTRPVIVLVAALGLSACQPPPPVVSVVDAGCDWARPIYINDLDQFSDVTARAVLAHNEVWTVRCGTR